jgi:hypothetical protein
MGAHPPTTAPQKDSRKSHVAKPDPFKDRRDFDKFNQSAYLYMMANPGEFPDDKSKVMFYLSYMKEGLLGQFAKNIVQRMMDYEVRGLKIDPEFEEFMEALMSTFGDVNTRVMAQEQLSRSYQGKMPAEAFFQMFEQRVWAAKYEYGHDKYLIQVLKKALNGCYNCATPRDGNTQLFSKEQTKGGTSAQRGSTQDRPIIKQAPDKRQSDSLLRQWNNESLRQAQIPREWEIQRLRDGEVQSENR